MLPVVQSQTLPPGQMPPSMQPGAQPGQASPREMLLAQMNDVIPPEPVGLWPPAPGWWVLALVVVGLLVTSAFLLWRRRKQNRYKVRALAELDIIADKFQVDSKAESAQAINAVLKKTALNAYPYSRNRLAALHGPEWLAFLDSALKKPAPHKPDESWISRMYQTAGASETINRETLIRFARHWVKHHAALTPPRINAILDGEPGLDDAEAKYV